jgi:Pyridoxamine 5'-phosphate oxidase
VFEHTINYRSAMIYGQPRLVTDPAERLAGLRCITERVAPGRPAALCTDGFERGPRGMTLDEKQPLTSEYLVQAAITMPPAGGWNREEGLCRKSSSARPVADGVRAGKERLDVCAGHS